MLLEFYKYHSNGNDFVIINNKDNLHYLYSLATKLCNRRYGIGADGLIFINSGQTEDYDYSAFYYNQDGTNALCGNGSMCSVHLATKLGMTNKENVTFLVNNGIYSASISNNSVKLKMHDISDLVDNGDDTFFVNSGTNHYVKFVNTTKDDKDFLSQARDIRNSVSVKNKFGNCNVNFVYSLGAGVFFMRTYEKGVEGETPSCGTGAVAVAITINKKIGIPSPIKLISPGGELQVHFDRNQSNTYNNIYLSGKVNLVYTGTIDI